jgi:hypothetical protein
MSLKTTEFVTNSNMVIVSHPLYSLDLASCDFAFFPKFKMKLKGRRFEMVSDNQRELQAILYSIKENDFHAAFEAWKKTIVPKETILNLPGYNSFCLTSKNLFFLLLLLLSLLMLRESISQSFRVVK